MRLKQWLASLVSSRGRAMSLYRAGMAKARRQDYRGAIADYTLAIESGEAPTDVRGMAIYNRALAYTAVGEDAKAADDLAAMLKMPGLPENVVHEARQRRERIRRRLHRDEAAS
jgi:hypothetical protein